MAVNLGINGFGRIGRCVLRAALQRDDINVVAINHKSRRLPAGEDYAARLAHTLKYDSVHGKLDLDVCGENDIICIGGRKIKVLAEADPASLPWRQLGVDIAVESTGKFNNPEAAAAHFTAGAKKVVLTAPAKGEALTVVMGVNQHMYDPAVHHVVSNASCTTNCLAPLAKVLHDHFGIVTGLMTTVHAVTNDQQILDMPHRDMRRGRSGMMSIIPTTTGAAKAVALVLPELKGRLNGFAMRVPTPDVSVVDLTVSLARPASREDVNGALKEAAATSMRGIMAYSELPLVSTDYIGDSHSCIVDAPLTMVTREGLVKVVAWYDNEWGYANRVLDLVAYMARRGL
ncbi:MAG: type I glyceraldehyde-3-phosphate dehydrogenase [Desulfurispora sp.]|uniref:type I glyceraldehyde-3-phosphate dehydrogenase n=1 Tax=Desulfurispora sp. TaxID=3014275 RepID=UPI00404A279E